MRHVGKSRVELLETIDRPALNALPNATYAYAEWKALQPSALAECRKIYSGWRIPSCTSTGHSFATAFALMLYTGQRRSDVHRMSWSDVTEASIRVVQQKTGRKLAIPLHREMLAILAMADRNHATIINTERGQPFTVDGFSQWLRDAITDAGLPLDCQPHGLRKAAGRRLAEAGCTTHEIMSMLGHKTLTAAGLESLEAFANSFPDGLN